MEVPRAGSKVTGTACGGATGGKYGKAKPCEREGVAKRGNPFRVAQRLLEVCHSGEMWHSPEA